MKTGTKKIVKIRKGARDVSKIMVGHHMVFGDKSTEDYDYTFENGVLTIYKAPYSASEGVVTIQ